MLLKTLVGKVTGAGFYNNWSYDAEHRKQNQLRGIFRSTWPRPDGNNNEPLPPLPWRLSKQARLLLDRRMGKLIWPERVEKLYYGGASFWTKPCRIWKARRKFTLLFFILPCQLRDHVPAVRFALNEFVWSMRNLLVGLELVLRHPYFHTHTYTQHDHHLLARRVKLIRMNELMR